MYQKNPFAYIFILSWDMWIKLGIFVLSLNLFKLHSSETHDNDTLFSRGFYQSRRYKLTVRHLNYCCTIYTTSLTTLSCFLAYNQCLLCYLHQLLCCSKSLVLRRTNSSVLSICNKTSHRHVLKI